jgi:hypothetical protein
MSDYPYKAKERIEALIRTLRATVDQDGEQEVRGIAVPVLNAVVEEIKVALRDDPVVRTVSDVISPEAAAAGEPIRAVDALLIAEQLDAAIGRRPTANAAAYAAGVAMRRRLFER